MRNNIFYRYGSVRNWFARQHKIKKKTFVWRYNETFNYWSWNECTEIGKQEFKQETK